MSTVSSASTSATAMPSASTSTQGSSSRKTHNRDTYIQPGDLIIVFASRDKTPLPLTVTPGEHVSNMFGHFPHDDMVGMPYGSKMVSKNGRGYVYLLRPTPELWTLALPHRTQILYAPDMSFISMKLGMGPGSRVIEAGTGSGSFSHVIARTVGRADVKEDREKSGLQVPRNWRGLPNHLQQNLSRGRGQPRDLEDGNDSTKSNDDATKSNTPEAEASSSTKPDTDSHVPSEHGRLWSFEFHEPRAEKARAEFAAHGMDKVIVLNHRNVCKEGFGLNDTADSVFLDLPAPWEAVDHATKALRRDRVTRICCFSPCIEQVLKTVTALTEHGFTDVETFESLVRTHESHSAAGPEASIDEAIDRIRMVEKRKETRRLIQIEKAKSAKAQAAGAAGKTAEVAIANGNDEGDTSMASNSHNAAGNARKHKLDNDEDEQEGNQGNDPSQAKEAANGTYQRGVQEGIAVTKKKARMLKQQTQQSQPMQAATVYSRPYYEVCSPSSSRSQTLTD
ncbi:related to GCD14 - translational repressor of GCN4 [Ustilago bromivora]|uniref:tRNA (adenine(58)-N(1))-methyltransferase catalytic subunit TRM61 n=1 Tax=Ustilago bromivora TaxID=307758 RepID=A0A8H8QHJ8_9BASI|nr:related to GCD14 - translational repressor of GCN4 [Ustilago bromivora]